MLNIIDNYVGNFEISVFNKITTTEMNFKANINFNIIKIDIENKNAQIQLVYNIEMKDKVTLKDLGTIKLTMNAILNSDTKLDKDAFEKKLFNEGIYTLADGTIVSGGEGGITTAEEAEALNKIFEEQYLNTKKHGGSTNNRGAYQGGPYEKWWSSNYNQLEPFQCTWWAWGRASQYLEQIGSKYSKYPTAYGDGGEYYVTNIQGGWFKYGKEPKPNSIVSWTQGGKWGHVAYVEGVTDDGIYISHAGGGDSWFGIMKIPLNGSLDDWDSGYQLNGYIYLDEPN